MNGMIEITLPWPVSTNVYYRNIAGKTIISEKGRAYRKAVADQVLIQRGAKQYTGRLAIDIDAHVPDKRRRDLDNLLKATFDSMTHAGVWLDDSQLDQITITRRAIGGMLKIKVWEL